ncbi:helix-turn-helix domain-containing protein [Klebsiella quasivariicola]|uniref:helix-turn-helix domain-containing protein n=1 Tax=Klebsiella quasivariicola TaxID=2026240 RepID=UPI00247B2950|nr:helix-turn-helix domain-containing protein [Klebsiella quasivariicola]HBR0793111.1 helix-turn-helix domain-containing protein [Klebsiella pneumoniae]HBX9936642.1 helix-turn-helix domain-containing protein [Klebsiella variicola]HCI5974509.1 helix-turn-helix domain-containing protein [Klebsiella quasipneumoniae subsp. similipneumoniae]HBV1861766.1 helix-turn-helix domain-containing protein [Klebsiella pneumoniae]HCI5846364.1 helix-turn-helix domain-containing protein [Klebsiella pneumoniae]
MRQSMTGSNYETPGFAPSIAGAFIVASSLFLSSTGSNFSVKDVNQWRGYVQPKVQFGLSKSGTESEVENDVVDIRTISDHLNNVRNTLAPSMSELAKDLGITRQALYKWLSGESQPDDIEKASYIIELSRLSDRFNEAGIVNAKLMAKMKAFDGFSIIDLIKRGDNWQQSVSTLIEEARNLKDAGVKANLTGSKASSTDGWMSSVSIPGSGVRE